MNIAGLLQAGVLLLWVAVIGLIILIVTQPRAADLPRT